MINPPVIVASLALITSPLMGAAADWPQYHGPTFDNKSPERIAQVWPEQGLKEIWRVPMKTGFSSLSVADGRAFTLVRQNVDRADQEAVLALDAGTGKQLWIHPLTAAKYDGGGDSGASGNRGGDGPRSTPSVDGDRVFAYSSGLLLVCLEAASGKRVWSVDILKDHNGKNITWQGAASPVIEGDLVCVFGGGPGEALLAFNKRTGKLAWSIQDDGMTHSTPTPATLHGVRQIVFFTQEGLVGVEAVSGRVLWRQGYPFRGSRACSPIVSGNRVYVSQGYGVGAGVYQVNKNGEVWSSEEVWRAPNKQMNHWNTPVVLNGHLYGIYNHNSHAKAPLKCIELATGNERWAEEGFGMGNLVFADGRLVVLTDYGDLVLVAPDPVNYKGVSRMKALAGKCWSTPSISNGRLFVRSTTEAACFEIAP